MRCRAARASERASVRGAAIGSGSQPLAGGETGAARPGVGSHGGSALGLDGQQAEMARAGGDDGAGERPRLSGGLADLVHGFGGEDEDSLAPDGRVGTADADNAVELDRRAGPVEPAVG